MDNWLKILAPLVISAAIALVGHWYTQAQNEREFGLRNVELAISILAEEPKPHTAGLRGWAVDVINQYSSIKMPAAVKKDLTIKRLDITRTLDIKQIQPARPVRPIER